MCYAIWVVDRDAGNHMDIENSWSSPLVGNHRPYIQRPLIRNHPGQSVVLRKTLLPCVPGCEKTGSLAITRLKVYSFGSSRFRRSETSNVNITRSRITRAQTYPHRPSLPDGSRNWMVDSMPTCVVVRHLLVVNRMKCLCSYKKTDWRSPIRGLCGIGMISDSRSKIEHTGQQWGPYCSTAPKHRLWE